MIAITGLACRLPGADSVDAALTRLRAGAPAFTWADRWGEPAFGAWLDDPCAFDPAPFGLSAYEAARMDPQHRLLLMAAREAVEDAGLSPRDLARSRTGVWIAMGSQDWAWRTAVRGGHVDAYSVLGLAAGQAAGRIAALFDLRGPAVVVDAGCAATLVAVDAAARAIAAGEVDRAIVGAVQVVLAPEGGRMLAAMGVEAEGEPPRPFHPDSPGSVRGEGVGVLILEREGRVPGYARVRGTAVVQAGAALRGGVPAREVLVDTMRRALVTADVPAASVGWVEAHGTGAPAADTVEMDAIRAVYEAPVGSAKGVVGHLEAAAGFVGIVAALARATSERPLVAVNTFGMSGTVAHLLLEGHGFLDGIFLGRGSAPQRPARGGEAPPGPPDAVDGPLVLGLSAATPTALAAAVERWTAALSAPGADPAGLCRAAARRAPLPYRAAASGRTAEALVAALRGSTRAPFSPPPGGEKVAEGRMRGREVLTTPRVGFLFTGQGAQEAGMGRGLYAADAAFREAFDAAAAAFAAHGVDVAALCFGGGDLRDTRLAQPALFALQWALAGAWAARGLRPDVVVGHSIGELAAAAVAGALTLHDAVAIVVARATAMGSLPPGGVMLAVLAPRDEVVPHLVDLPLDVAVENAPRQVVVAGPEDAIAALEERLEDAMLPSTRLRTSHAFHSRLQEPCLPFFTATIADIPAAPPRIPWVSTASAARVERAPDAAYWAMQLRGTVRFREAMVAAAPLADVWVEVGPGDTLVKHARATAVEALASLPGGAPEPDGFAAATAALFQRGADVLPDDGGPAARAPGYPWELRRFGPEGLVPDTAPRALIDTVQPGPAARALIDTVQPGPAARALIDTVQPGPAARADDDPVVIVGLAVRLPGAPDVEALAATLHAPVVGIGEAPAGRAGGVAGWLPDALRFDAAAFGISRREAARMDPRQGLALELAWEALERSGLGEDPRPTGVFVGVSGGEPRPVADDVDPQALTGRVEAAIAGRVAYALGLEGPALCVDAACASSLVALHLAAESVRRGECARALAGGVQILGTPHGAALVAATGALSPSGRARPFDVDADGFVRGEGGVFVVLARRSEARARGLHVWGTLLGSAVGHGGGGGGFAAPDPVAQERVLRAALGALDPRAVAYVEAHGTGTRLGDPVEAGAIGRVYGGVALGSAKARFGHLEPAAGVTGLARLLVAMANGRLPTQASVARMHPEVAKWGHHVPTGAEPWPAGALGAVSAVGMTGTIAHVVVAPGDGLHDGVREGDRRAARAGSDAPTTPMPTARAGRPARGGPTEAPRADPGGSPTPASSPGARPRWRIELSARSPGALRSLCDRWAAALDGRAVDVADVAWTALSRRRGPARRAVVAGTVEELVAGLVAEGDEPGGTLPAGGRIVDLPIAAWGGETWAAPVSAAIPRADAVTTRPPGTRLETLLADLLPSALDAPEVPLGELGLDSLGALVLAGAVPTVPAATLRTLPYRALREVGAGGTSGVSVPTVAPTPVLEPRPSLALPDVRLERISDGRGVPLVVVVPGAADAWEGLDLGDRPVWLARSWALEAGEGGSIVPFGVAFAAAVGALLSGPVAWCGWSIGGTIAWEAAARREAAGGEAPLVVLLDTYGPGVAMPADLGPLARAWSAASGSDAVDAWRTGLQASARRVAGWSPPSRRGDTLRIHATERAGVPVGWETGAEVWVEADHYSLVRGEALRRVAGIVREALATAEARDVH